MMPSAICPIPQKVSCRVARTLCSGCPTVRRHAIGWFDYNQLAEGAFPKSVVIRDPRRKSMANWGLWLCVWCLRSLERVAAVENLLASRSSAVLWNYLNTSRAAFSTGASRTQVPRTNGVRDATYRPTWRKAGRPGGRTGEPNTFTSSKCLWRNECGTRRDANRPPCRKRLAPSMPGVWTGITSR